MSSSTKICPSQATLAPIPIVGIGTAAVNLRASGSATASITTEMHPPADRNRVFLDTRPVGFFAALGAE
jgi:hypothetical protein